MAQPLANHGSFVDEVSILGTRFITGGACPPPRPDNDNLRLMADWMTPAELMQWIGRTREEMRRELAANFSLRNDPEHRKQWEALHAMERCALWHHYGVRD
jgi:hypothetical protein